MLYEQILSKNFTHIERNDHVAILGDSLEVMKSMKSNSINLIFADIDGSTIKQGTLRRYAKKIGKIISKDFGFHSLRTAHATELLTAGVAIKLVKERLGHSTIQTTLNHYTSISKGMEEQCINALDGLYEY